MNTRTLKTYRLKTCRHPPELCAWCPACETVHHHPLHDDNGRTVAPRCIEAGSPFADGYTLDVVGDVDDSGNAAPAAPFAARGTPLWRRLNDTGNLLKAATAGALLRLRKPLDYGSVPLPPASGTRRLTLNLTRHLWRVEGGPAGEDLLTAGAWLDGVTPGLVGARLLEAATGVRLDAEAFLAVADALDGFFARGAPAGKGRRP